MHHFNDLPEEVIELILSRVGGATDRTNTRLVCKKWARICPLPVRHAHAYLAHPKEREAGGNVFVYPYIADNDCIMHLSVGDHIFFCEDKLVRSRPEEVRPGLPLLFISPFSGVITLSHKD